MQFSSVLRWTLGLALSFSAAAAQTAGPPSETKSTVDPTSKTRPEATTAPAPTPQTSAPEPAPAADSLKSAEPATAPPASASDDKVPTTTIYPQPDAKAVLVPKLDPGPLPKNKSALIGGTVKDIDQIRNRMTVEIFGKGGKMNLLFDPRTKFDRNGVASSQSAIKKGDQVYVDTQLINHKVFARDVYVRSGSGVADASGQVVYYNPKTQELKIHDQMSLSEITVHLTPNTIIKNRTASGSATDLQANTLVSVKLSPADKGRSIANEVDIIAQPGNQFAFLGVLTHIDLRSGVMAIDNKSDHKLYDIRFDPQTIVVTNDLKVGREVAVNAIFNGRDYTAQTLTMTPTVRSGDPE